MAHSHYPIFSIWSCLCPEKLFVINDMIFSVHPLGHYFCQHLCLRSHATRGQVSIRWSRSYLAPMAASSRRWLSLSSLF